MRIQLWSYNYDPEPIGIAPVSSVFARAMQERGHTVEVVAAHPHYPEARWGQRLRPYREVRDGVRVVRLPLWIGRASGVKRVRQEASFAAVMSLAAPLIGRADVIVAVSPCFPALAPAMATARARRTPWVLWLQDILPDGAVSSGILDDGALVRLARRLEHAAYRSASRIVVISESFEVNLRDKGVDPAKLVRVCNPATRPILAVPRDESPANNVVLTMGNIGRTQNLVAVTRSFESSEELRRLDARLTLVGEGQAKAAVRAAIRTDRVRLTGVLDSDSLDRELRCAAVAIVSQAYRGPAFNVPSKLMNFMGYGLPTVASVPPQSEVARLITASGGGWVTDSADTGRLATKLAEVLQDRPACAARGRAALTFAQQHFSPQLFAERFEAGLLDAVGDRRGR
jgi:colanic acid biosynthesis glycosyl transferase WcaI